MSWKPHDFIALILTAVIGIGLLLITYSVRIMDKPLTEKQEALMEAVVIGLVAIISGYVGAKIQQKRDKNGDD